MGGSSSGKGSSAPSSAPAPNSAFQQWLSQYSGPSGQQQSSSGGGGGESSFPSAPRPSGDQPKQPPTIQPVIILNDNPTLGDRLKAAATPGPGTLFGIGGTAIQAGWNAYHAKGSENVGGGAKPGQAFPVSSAKPTLPGTPSTSRSGKSLISDDDEDSVFGGGGSDYGMAGIT